MKCNIAFISNTYSSGRPKNYGHYMDVAYKWNGENRKLIKVKRGLPEKKGRTGKCQYY